MKTTHQLAADLLLLPDIPLGIEGWCEMNHHEMTASITDYDDNRAIIWQKPSPHLPKRTEHGSLRGDWKWVNIRTVIKCTKCDGEMKPGQALQQTFTSGSPDFPEDKVGITLSPGGPGELVDVLKCRDCGHSFTI